MFLIIGVSGAEQRRIYAAFKFFLYTLLGSVLMLVAMMVMYHPGRHDDIEVLRKISRSPKCRPGCGWLLRRPSR
jgi:NADH-quinone oxidoreductase subunit M